MYKTYYHFKGTPFSKDIKPKDQYQNDNLKELASRFEYIKKYKGIMLLTGEPGTGKTTAIRSFISSLNEDAFYPIYLPLSTVNVKDFYSQLNDKLKGDFSFFKKSLFESIQTRILDLFNNQNKMPVIILDEAHFLKNENFFELQIITNFRMDSYDPYILILCAQSHLTDRLARPLLRPMKQRIALKYHLPPLSASETRDYITHHFSLHSVSCELFSEAAYKAIYSISKGVIRIIGKLTVKTLELGAGMKKERLTEEDVLMAAKEL